MLRVISASPFRPVLQCPAQPANLEEQELKADRLVPQQSRSSKLPANPSVFRALGTGILFLAVWGGGEAAMAQSMSNPDAARFGAFERRLQHFVELKKEIEARVPDAAPSNDPARLEQRQKAFAKALQEARLEARPGDIFGESAAEIGKIMQQDARARGGADLKAAMEEVPKQQPLQVNMEYPKDEPVATVPPLLLARLPRLPDGLEYRFIGRALILRDAASNLIVDFISQAVPAVSK